MGINMDCCVNYNLPTPPMSWAYLPLGAAVGHNLLRSQRVHFQTVAREHTRGEYLVQSHPASLRLCDLRPVSAFSLRVSTY